jgi:hypothetical protein
MLYEYILYHLGNKNKVGHVQYRCKVFFRIFLFHSYLIMHVELTDWETWITFTSRFLCCTWWRPMSWMQITWIQTIFSVFHSRHIYFHHIPWCERLCSFMHFPPQYAVSPYIITSKFIWTWTYKTLNQNKVFLW